MEDAFRLSELLIQLRNDLQAVKAADEGTDLKFELGVVELELKLVAEQQAGGEVGAGWWVLKGSASAKQADAATQTLKLTLKPVDAPTGRPAQIGDTGRLPRSNSDS